MENKKKAIIFTILSWVTIFLVPLPFWLVPSPNYSFSENVADLMGFSVPIILILGLIFGIIAFKSSHKLSNALRILSLISTAILIILIIILVFNVLVSLPR